MKRLSGFLIFFITTSISFAQQVRDHRSGANKKPYTPSQVQPPPVAEKKVTQPGDLLPGFARSGALISTYPSEFIKVGVQPSGKIIVLSHYVPRKSYDAVLRYNSNGTLDSSFGSNGLVYLFYEQSKGHSIGVQASDMVIQPDGKILLVSQKRIFRYTVNGAHDATLGTAGVVLIELAGVELDFEAMTLDGNKIVVTGNSSFSSVEHLTMARLNSDGSLDTDFNRGGIRIVALSDGINYSGQSVAIDKNHNILIGVRKGMQTASVHLGFITRYTYAGSLDLNFASHGIRNTEHPTFSIALNSNYIYYEGYNLMQMNLSGSQMKPVFIGATSFQRNYPLVFAGRLFAQPDGKIIMSGSTYNNINDYAKIILKRFTPDGLVDYSFGKNGNVATDLNNNGQIRDVIYTNNIIYLAGYVNNHDPSKGLLLAYDGSGKITATSSKVGVITTKLSKTDFNKY